MDPNEALKVCRAAAATIHTNTFLYGPADDLAESFDALDAWLSKGGFLPTAWERVR